MKEPTLKTNADLPQTCIYLIEASNLSAMIYFGLGQLLQSTVPIGVVIERG